MNSLCFLGEKSDEFDFDEKQRGGTKTMNALLKFESRELETANA